jgi:hypothetical protein
MDHDRDPRCQLEPNCHFRSVFYCKKCSGTPIFYCEAHQQAHLSFAARHASKPIYKALTRPQVDDLMQEIKSKLQAIQEAQQKVNKAVAAAIEKINSIGNEARTWLDKEYAKTKKLEKLLLIQPRLYFQDEEDLLFVNAAEIERQSKARTRKMRKLVEGFSVVNEASPERTPVADYRRASRTINSSVRSIRTILYSPYASNDFKIRALRENGINVDIKAKTIRSVLMLRNNKYAIIWKDKNILVFYDLSSKKQSMQLEIPGEVQMMTVTEDSALLITSLKSKELHFWDIQTKDLIFSFAMDSRIDFIHQFPNIFLLYSWDSMLFSFDSKNFSIIDKQLMFPKTKSLIELSMVAHTKDYKTIIVGGTDGHIRSFLVSPFGNPKNFCGLNTPPTCFSLSSDEKKLFAGTAIGKIAVWTMESAEVIIVVNAGGQIVGVMPSEDNDSFVSANSDNKVKVWGVEDGRMRKEVKRRSEIDGLRRNFPEIECFDEKLKS